MKQINEVNLEKIFDKTSHYMIEYDKQMCLRLMREACEQTVDLCAYNLVKGKNCELLDNKLVVYTEVSKVLNTKKQIV